MAVATMSSRAALGKAVVVLPLVLALLAVAAAGASSAEDGRAVAQSGGRFSDTPLGRKLLTVDLCGPGTFPDYDCKFLLSPAYNATCCPDALGGKGCWDVGAYYLDKCGSCTTKCKVGEFCCRGVCIDPTTDNDNCGICGNKCPSKKDCKFSICGY